MFSLSVSTKTTQSDYKSSTIVLAWITGLSKPRRIFTNNKTCPEQKLVTVKWSRFRTYVIERWRLICIARRFMLMSLIYCYFYLILGIIIWTVSVWMRIIFYALRRSFPQLRIDPAVRIIFAFSSFIAGLCVAVCYSAVSPFVVWRKRWIGQKLRHMRCQPTKQNLIFCFLWLCGDDILGLCIILWSKSVFL